MQMRSRVEQVRLVVRQTWKHEAEKKHERSRWRRAGNERGKTDGRRDEGEENVLCGEGGQRGLLDGLLCLVEPRHDLHPLLSAPVSVALCLLPLRPLLLFFLFVHCVVGTASTSKQQCRFKLVETGSGEGNAMKETTQQITQHTTKQTIQRKMLIAVQMEIAATATTSDNLHTWPLLQVAMAPCKLLLCFPH